MFLAGKNIEDTNTSLTQSTSFRLSQTEFLRELNISKDETITWNRTLEGLPTLNFNFDICIDQKLATKQALEGKEVNLFGHGWRVQTVNFGREVETRNLISVSLSLTSINANYGNVRNNLDKKIRLNHRCRKNSYWERLSKYANLAGVDFRGLDPYIKVPLNTSGATTVSVRSLASVARARTVGGFLYWSNNGVEIRKWRGTTNHRLTNAEIASFESHSFSGQGGNAGNCKLAIEYRNTRLELKPPEEDKSGNGGVSKRWGFDDANSLIDCQLPADAYQVGEQIYIAKNPDKTILRNPGLSFDNGTKGKTANLIYEFFGVETFRKTKKYNWRFTSLDVFAIVRKESTFNGGSGVTIQVGDYYKIIFTPFKTKSFVASYWGEVESFTTDRLFDRDGYLYKELHPGKRLMRLKQDSSGLEGIKTLFQGMELLQSANDTLASNPTNTDALADYNKAIALIKLSEAFKFKETISTLKTTTFDNRSLRKEFPLLYAPEPEQCDFVEPKYPKIALTTERTREIRENPGSTPEFPLPPIEIGRIATQRRDMAITSKSKPYRYTVTESVVNQEGEGLDKKAKINSHQELTGTPGLQQRLTNTELPQKPTYPNAISSIPDINSQYTYLLNSNDSAVTNDLSNDSISFPDVFDPQLGKYAAEIDLDIRNTKATNILEVKLKRPKLNYQEGDLITLDNGETRVINSINFSFKDSGIRSCFNTENYTLSLGMPIEGLSVNLKTINSPITNAIANNSYSVSLVSIDGNLSNFSAAEIEELNLITTGDGFDEQDLLEMLTEEEKEESEEVENELNGDSPSIENLEGLLGGSGGDGFDINGLSTEEEETGDVNSGGGGDGGGGSGGGGGATGSGGGSGGGGGDGGGSGGGSQETPGEFTPGSDLYGDPEILYENVVFTVVDIEGVTVQATIFSSSQESIPFPQNVINLINSAQLINSTWVGTLPSWVSWIAIDSLVQSVVFTSNIKLTPAIATQINLVQGNVFTSNIKLTPAIAAQINLVQGKVFDGTVVLSPAIATQVNLVQGKVFDGTVVLINF